MNANAPVVLISGCSTGIGRALAMEFAARNWWVFATARKPAAINDLKVLNMETAALDVTDEKSIAACVDSVIAKAGRIGMLVNNAGLLLIARFPRAFIEALLSKKFGLDRLRNHNK